MAEEEPVRGSEGGFRRLFLQAAPSEDVDMVDADPICNPSSHGRAPPQNGDALIEDHSGAESSARRQGRPEGPSQAGSGYRSIVAVDFGTTFSTVAFLRTRSDTWEGLIPPESIRCVDHYPDPPPGSVACAFALNTTVPSELWYRTEATPARQKGPSNGIPRPADDDEEYDSPLDDERVRSTPTDSEREPDTPPVPQQKARRPVPVFGYGAQKKSALPDDQGVKGNHVARFKLLLDEEEGERVQDLRQRALADLKVLRSAHLAQDAGDLIADYLEQLFKHAKDQLLNFHGLQENDDIEYVLCVPTMWTEKACRVMQNAMARAIERSQLGRLEDGCIKDLFIVAEPEAAAAFALADGEYSARINPGETFLLLDCGGGTVDAITYQVTQTDPVRLKEVVPATGVSCGSSFLNDAFRRLLEVTLAGARIEGSTLENTIRSKVLEFENGQKRTIDITKKKAIFEDVSIQGLQADETRGLGMGRIHLKYKEMKDVYKNCLRGVAKLMREQLQQAKEARDEDRGDQGYNVQKVILIGGFGDSPSLQSHLQNVLSEERNLLGQRIELLLNKHIDSAVARGAILRALNKADGPSRISRTSYGILCSDLFERDNLIHQGRRGRRDHADGELYISNTIHWEILVVRKPLREPRDGRRLTLPLFRASCSRQTTKSC